MACGEWKGVEEFGKKGNANSGVVRRDPYCALCKSKLRATQYRRKQQMLKRKPRDNASLNIADCEFVEVTVDGDKNALVEALQRHAMDSILAIGR